MTNERAIEKRKQLVDYLKYSLEIGSDCCLLDEDKKELITALKYRIPKKPIFQPRVYFGFDGHTCPNCGQYIKSKSDPILPRFCRDCGQALDWT